jgi:hypothetical protein
VRGLTPAYTAAVEMIDSANAEDPSQILVRGALLPLALAHGRLAVDWVSRLVADPDEPLLLAARAHHLRRWEVPRTDYPAGRPGYLRWRRDQKARHAREVGVILVDAGYGAEAVGRAQRLVRREGLGTDPEAQVVEDAACLVFIETQLVAVSERFERDHLLEVIRKTARKMSPAALALVSLIPLAPAGTALLSDALGDGSGATTDG